ncbi:methyltransferase domain-containing protein [Candidatus Protochlamydia phocaeensis]|uniref:methyltransferase domain-containing protein n=1 Tax=Candidatus Protochlamydia phocaeensis TaxID=1414722 RepID=UPI000A78800A|nr:methyltransferase domain-containing protein [Candidatus Protochlamydia phocaeensis]
MMKHRLNQPEWIDLGPAYYTPSQYRDCLYQLDRVGRWLGGDRATYWAFDRLSSPRSILDVGCGGGLFTMRLAERYPHAQVAGIDLSQEAIDFAQEHLVSRHPPLSNLSFQVPPSPHLDYSPGAFDIITATLVCHHLSDSELIDFLKQAFRIAKQAIILNDLHRHPLAWLGFSAIMPFLFPNRLVWHDGLLSIQRAFKRKDWLFYLQAAGIPLERCSINWHWAFRWMIIIDTANLPLKERALDKI